jgi:hypothetical protein
VEYQRVMIPTSLRPVNEGPLSMMA